MQNYTKNRQNYTQTTSLFYKQIFTIIFKRNWDKSSPQKLYLRRLNFTNKSLIKNFKRNGDVWDMIFEGNFCHWISFSGDFFGKFSDKVIFPSKEYKTQEILGEHPMFKKKVVSMYFFLCSLCCAVRSPMPLVLVINNMVDFYYPIFLEIQLFWKNTYPFPPKALGKR